MGAASIDSAAWRRGGTRGKSDAIDALAVARAALQEPLLDGPRGREETLRQLARTVYNTLKTKPLSPVGATLASGLALDG